MTDFAAELRELSQSIERARSANLNEEFRELLVSGLETAHEELRVADEEVRVQQAELERLVTTQRLGLWQHDRLLAVLPSPVLVTDTAGRINTVNAAAATFLRTRIDEVIRKPLQVFVEPAQRPELRTLLSRAVAEGTEFRTELTLVPRKSDPVRAQVLAAVGVDPVTARTEVTWLVLTSRERERRSVPTSTIRALSDLTALPLHSEDLPAGLRRVAMICGAALGPEFDVTVTVGEPSSPDLLSSSDDIAQRVDGAQIVAAEGPCQEAWETGHTVLSDDLKHDERWVRLGERIADVPVRGAIAVPVRMGDEQMGVLNIYARDASSIDDEHREVAELLATAVGAILHEIEVKGSLEELATQLRAALDSRAPIEQAKGLLMAQRGCSADEAFQILVDISSRSNIKVRDLAVRLVKDAEQQATARRPRSS